MSNYINIICNLDYVVIYRFWYLGAGYFQSEVGKLCSENGDLAVDDLATCKTAAIELSYLFSVTEEEADWPKGCYMSGHNVFFNEHGYGSANNNAKQICKATGKW